MTIKDDVIHCDCPGCMMHCRVPSNVFGTGDDAMRQWAHNNAKGGSTGNGTLTLNWSIAEHYDGDDNLAWTKDYCCSQCNIETCGHRRGVERQNPTETWITRFNDRVKKPKPPKPEPRIITPIGRMK